MEESNILIFIAVCIAATMSPGPAVVLAIRNGAIFGLKRASIGVLGNLAAMMTYAALASSGTAIIFSLFPSLLNVFQISGGIYLIYLGYRMLLSNEKWEWEAEGGISNAKIFSQALFTGLSNPKAIVFYASLFPQFITQGEGYILNSLLLSSIFACCSVFALLTYACVASLISKKADNQRVLNITNKLSGVVFIGFGTALLYRGTTRL